MEAGAEPRASMRMLGTHHSAGSGAIFRVDADLLNLC